MEILTHNGFEIEPVKSGRKWVAEVRGTVQGQFVIGEAKGRSKWYAIVAAKDLIERLRFGKFKLKFGYSRRYIHNTITDGNRKTGFNNNT